MDRKSASRIRKDKQDEESLETAMSEIVENRLKHVHTSMPGIIRSFNATLQTATVQPAIRRLFLDEKGWVALPQCVDVPVQFPGWGDSVMTFPVNPGDECLLSFSERAIDFWWDKGGVQLPAELRMHDLSDAFALMGFSSKGRAIPAFNTDAVEIRRRDGTGPKFVLDGDSAYVGGTAGAEPAVMGTTLANFLAALIVAVNSKPGGSPAPTLPTGLLAALARVS
jgi:hypothetical protein